MTNPKILLFGLIIMSGLIDFKVALNVFIGNLSTELGILNESFEGFPEI